MKVDFESFKQEFNQRLISLTAEQLQRARVTEAETRLEKLENWAQESHHALLLPLEQQNVLQEKLTDLESRSRQNNIRIYGASEGAEGESVVKYVETLKRELSLQKDFNLLIQRAHRSLMLKPADGTPPRLIIVNFLEFEGSVEEEIPPGKQIVVI